MTNPKQVGVGVAVFVVRSKTPTYQSDTPTFLMGKRKGAHGAGTWSIPGGHSEFGESPQEAARREVFEETGIEVGRCYPYVPKPYNNTFFYTEKLHYITLYFVGVAAHDAEPQLREPDKCEEWRWHHALTTPFLTPVFQPREGLTDTMLAWGIPIR